MYEDIEVYCGHLAEFYVYMYVKVSSYVEAYEDIDVYNVHEEAFCEDVDEEV